MTTTEDRTGKMKIVDISYFSEGEPDDSGTFSHAKLIHKPRPNLPKSFTLCNSMMVKAWTTESYTVAYPIILDQDDGNFWLFTRFYASEKYTMYTIYLPGWKRIDATNKGPAYFPNQWVRMCLSVDPDSGTARLVANGELMEDGFYESLLSTNETDAIRPTNLTVSMAAAWWTSTTAAQFADVNVFSTALSVEKMINLTTPGGEECGAAGDFMNWEDSEWEVFNKAEMLWVDREVGPCAPKSKVQVFAIPPIRHQKYCMDHCQKLGRGRSPPVRTLEEWESLAKEFDAISPNSIGYPWLAATEGDTGGTTLDMAFTFLLRRADTFSSHTILRV